MATASDLVKKKCQACHSGMGKLDREQITQLMAAVPGWQERDGKISKTYKFGNFHETMAFVNAVAWVAHREDHHPDMEVSYSKCVVSYNTHAVGGLTENDFICAAKVEELVA